MKSKYILVGLALSGIPHLAFAGSDINIPQIPPGSKMTETNGESSIKIDDGSGVADYQQEILNNPETNDQARTASSPTQEKNSGGNVATIVQSGKSNKSRITQSGKNNLASQTQKGNNNDIHLQQTGGNNNSVEKQTGNYNHKVIIQNGKKREETIIDNQDDQQ